ncbi:MAG: hypothetical protein AABW68_03885 [archaeon]
MGDSFMKREGMRDAVILGILILVAAVAIISSTPSANVIRGAVLPQEKTVQLSVGDFVPFTSGDSFTWNGAGSQAGKILTVHVVSVVATGPGATAFKAKFNLLDSTGAILDTQTVLPGNVIHFEDSIGKSIISGNLFLKSATVDVSTNEGKVSIGIPQGKALLESGGSLLLNGKGSFAGQPVRAKLISIVATGPVATSFQAKFNLVTTSGILIDTQTVNEGTLLLFEDSFGNEVVDEYLWVDSIKLFP